MKPDRRASACCRTIRLECGDDGKRPRTDWGNGGSVRHCVRMRFPLDDDMLLRAREYGHNLLIFQVETVEATLLVQGQRPVTRFSQDINLFYLAQEALRLGTRAAFHQKETEYVIEINSVFPVINIIRNYRLEDVNANNIIIFSVYPADFPYYARIFARNISLRGVLFIPAIHWIEAPEYYSREFIDRLREAVIYDIDDAICQNNEMQEMFHSLAVLVGGEFARERIYVAPCGYVPEDEPMLDALQQSRDEIRREMDLEKGDIALINSGGVWKWTDLDVFLQAFVQFHREQPGNPLRFFVMGLRQSNNSDHGEFIERFVRVIHENEDLVEGRAIRIFWEWEDAGRRLPRYNYGADVGVNVSKPSIENAQSFRQRFVDYVKAALPVINTTGDPMSRGPYRAAMFHVEAGNADSYIRAFREIADGGDRIQRVRETMSALRAGLRTDRVYLPMLKRLLATGPVPKRKRQALIDSYSGYASFAEIKARRGNLVDYGASAGPEPLELEKSKSAAVTLGLAAHMDVATTDATRKDLAFPGSDQRLQSEVGEICGNIIRLREGMVGSGLSGPSVELPIGRYSASIHFSAKDALRGTAVVEVVADPDGTTLACLDISADQVHDHQVHVPFECMSVTSNVEIRLFCYGRFEGSIQCVRIEPR